jgi:hypothetical protein
MRHLMLTVVLLTVVVSAWAIEVPKLTELREMYVETALVADGKAACVIVAPEDAAYDAVASKLAAAIKETCGDAPPIIPAGSITDEAMSATNVIALGVFANNPVVEKLYRRSLVICDWAWPKGETPYVIRTVHNPWVSGKNVVYLGGTTPESCAAAVERFSELLGESDGGVIGPIIEISPAPARLTEAQTAANIKQIEAETSSRTIDGLAARYADAYFTSGDPAVAGIFVATMRKLVELHNAEGDASDVRSCRLFFNQFDRIDEGPDFTDAERLELQNLVLQFASLLTYANTEVKPSEIPHGNNWNATGASHAGMYFSRYYPELDIGKQILANMDTYYEPNMTNWKVNEDCPGYGNITLTGNYDWALNRPDYRYFDLDCVRKMADYDMLITNNLGNVSGFGDANGLHGKYLVDVLTLAAWHYKDGRYLWWYDHHGGAPKRFWVPEEVLARERPDDLLGIKVAPLAEWLYNYRIYDRDRNMPRGACYDKVSFRSGFEDDDQYVSMSGVGYGFHAHPDANCIINYSDKGQTRLYDDGYMIPALAEHNTVTILKDGWAGRTPGLAQITAQADFDDVGIFESRLDNYNGVYWDRAVIWPQGRYYLVVDDLQCIEPAEYAFQCIWRTLGTAQLDGCRWTSLKEPGRFNLIAASDATLAEKQAAGTSLNSKPFPLSEARALVEAAKADMESGDSYQFANLFYTTDLADKPQHVDVYRAGDTTTYMIEDDGKIAAAGINRSTLIPGVAIEAGVFHLTTDTLTAAAATRLRVRGPLLASNMPVNVQVNLRTGEAQVAVKEDVEVTYSAADGEKQEVLKAGSHTLKLRPIDKEGLASVSGALSEQYKKYASAAGAIERPGPGTGEKLTKLWEYNDFRCFSNFAMLPGVKLSADGTPMTAAEAGYSVGEPPALLASGGNVMFHDGETVTLDIELPKACDIAQIVVKSRQLVSFNGGCGVSKLTALVSNDGFAKDTREFGLVEISAELPNSVVDYSMRPDKPMTASHVRIIAVPYTEKHNVYIESLQLNGTAPKEEIAASGFHMNGLQVADIDGDGRDEIFTGGSDKAIHAIGSDGSGMWQYPVEGVVNALTVVDGTGKGDYQIVAACEDKTMYSVKADGTENFTIVPPPRTYARPGYRGVQPFISRLTVAFNADIDGDGDAEIIIGSANWRTYVYDHLGELIWDEVCWAHTPTCGDAFDLDGDGKKEVVMGNSYTRAVVYSAEGKVIGSGGGSGHAGPTALKCADLDGNGKGEIVVGDRAGVIWFQEWQGRGLPNHQTATDIATVNIADLDGDGKLETVVASNNYILYIFDADGKPIAQTNLLTAVRDIEIADVLGDETPEIICACEDNTVKIVSPAGEILGWYMAAGWMGNLAVCELDGNTETKEIVVSCDDGTIYGLQVTP